MGVEDGKGGNSSPCFTKLDLARAKIYASPGPDGEIWAPWKTAGSKNGYSRESYEFEPKPEEVSEKKENNDPDRYQAILYERGQAAD